jgi:E3 ubiquitin-protein ligase TRIP12
MCSALGPNHVGAVRDALPVLCNLLQYSDAKIVDNACAALLHVADAYACDAALLAQLQEAGLINQALQLISSNTGGGEGGGGGPQTSVATYFGMIRLLSTCASGSAAIVEQLLKAGVVDTLQVLLAHCALLGSGGSVASGGPTIRTPDQLLEVMNLAHELLPAVPDASAMLLLGLPTHPAAAAAAGAAGSSDAGVGAAAAAAATAAPSSNSKALAEFLQSDPAMVLNMCKSLLPLTLQVGVG